MDMKTFKLAGVMEILMYLAGLPKGARRVDIRAGLNMNPATATKAVRVLIVHELIVENMYKDANVLLLTATGKELAEMVSNIVSLVLKVEEKSTVKSYIIDGSFKEDRRPLEFD